MSRAERRRELRAAGQHRSSSKKGRRPQIRVPLTPDPEPEVLRFPTLADKGVVVAKLKPQSPASLQQS